MKQKLVYLENLDDNAIGYRNFSGVERINRNTGRIINKEGKRNFAIFLDEQTANQLLQDGWNVKTRQNDYHGEVTVRYFLPVKVDFEGRYKPKVVQIIDDSKELLNEETVQDLDEMDILGADVCIRAYDWEVNGNTGRTAYLKEMYVTIDSNPFRKKYGY